MNVISLDPITRLGGQGRIDLFLNEDGGLENARLVIPGLQGFEKLCEGRPVEEMPRIAPRTCGAGSLAHHLAAAKAGDAVYGVDPPPTAKKLRELMHATFFVAVHAAHFYALAGPDFIAPKSERNLLGVIEKLGAEIGAQAMGLLKDNHAAAAIVGGRSVHAVSALVGGVSKPITEEERDRLVEIAKRSIETARLSLQLFDDVVLKDQAHVDLIQRDAFTQETYYVGLVDEQDHVNFYDGQVRVVDPGGNEFVKCSASEYLDVLAERVEPWTYGKFLYLKQVGWKGFVDGADSGVYRASPLGRLNAANGMATPLAQAEYERFYDTLGKPVHHTLATHWARLIELLYAAERSLELAEDPEIMGTEVRAIPTATPAEGVGIVAAPGGVVAHHYVTDERGLLTGVNLIGGASDNYAAMNVSVIEAARGLIEAGTEIGDDALDQIEMVLRAFDPC